MGKTESGLWGETGGWPSVFPRPYCLVTLLRQPGGTVRLATEATVCLQLSGKIRNGNVSVHRLFWAKSYARHLYNHSFIHSFNVPVLGTGITAVNQTDKSPCPWASLVAQWLRIHLPMQGTRVRSLVREDPTCHGATKSVHHNY